MESEYTRLARSPLKNIRAREGSYHILFFPGAARVTPARGRRLARVYSDAVVPYLTLVKSGISQIYYGKSGICTSRLHKRSDIVGAPARATGNAQYVVPYDVSDLF